MATMLVRDFEPEERSAAAQAALLELPGANSTSVFVSPGDIIEVDMDAGYLRGHGTQVVEGQLMATVCGVVERVNKLVSVKPLKTRYSAECGDVVVGRVSEIAQKRWKVDINSKQDAALMLSAVNLPGGVQRRRTNVDELNMRSVFEEGDAISAEVQQLMGDGQVALHTRNLKYGKLEGGLALEVPCVLIKRQKQHFQHLEVGVDVIFGVNGRVWVGAHVEAPIAEAGVPQSAEDEAEKIARPPVRVDAEVRERICRVANAIQVLAKLFFPIHAPAVLQTYHDSLAADVHAKDMLGDYFQTYVLEKEVERRVLASS